MNRSVSTTFGVFKVLYDTQVYHHKTYSWLSLAGIQKALLNIHGISVSVRTVRWQLKKLSTLGFTKYYPKKCGRTADGTVFVRPPNRSVTSEGLKWLRRWSVKTAKWLEEHLLGKNKLARAKGPDDFYIEKSKRDSLPAPPGGLKKFLSKIGKITFF